MTKWRKGNSCSFKSTGLDDNQHHISQTKTLSNIYEVFGHMVSM